MRPHPVSNSLVAIISDNCILDYISDIINIKISLLYMITIGFLDHGAMVEHEKTADVGVFLGCSSWILEICQPPVINVQLLASILGGDGKFPMNWKGHIIGWVETSKQWDVLPLAEEKMKLLNFCALAKSPRRFVQEDCSQVVIDLISELDKNGKSTGNRRCQGRNMKKRSFPVRFTLNQSIDLRFWWDGTPFWANGCGRDAWLHDPSALCAMSFFPVA